MSRRLQSRGRDVPGGGRGPRQGLGSHEDGEPPNTASQPPGTWPLLPQTQQFGDHLRRGTIVVSQVKKLSRDSLFLMYDHIVSDMNCLKERRSFLIFLRKVLGFKNEKDEKD